MFDKLLNKVLMYSFFLIASISLILPICIAVNVKILQFTELKTDSQLNKNISQSLIDGLNVAANTANNPNSSFYPNTVEIIMRETNNNNTLQLEILKDMAKDPELIALYGTIGDDSLFDILPNLSQYNLTLFNPYVGNGRSFFWSPYVFYTSASTYIEVVAMLTELVIFRQLRRVSYMYSEGFEWPTRRGEMTKSMVELFNLN